MERDDIMHSDKDFKNKPQILIVDDSEMNRAILSEMLGDEYHILEAEDGAQAVAILQKHSAEISLVLLDIVMPVMDGYGVLRIMNSKHWIEDTAVIMISAENSSAYVERAYELGVTDFISRPFDALVVRRRVVNTIMLYAKQRKLAGMVADQIYEKEKNSNLMISILSHIVEFRNGESGLHVIHVQNYTEILLRHLVRITDKYILSDADITLISHASALHDIGKISIPDEILNKPGRLTDEEFEIMKGHSMAGADMLGDLTAYSDEPLVKVAYEICRWHHERFDGRGYPDGLKGDDIPVSAQIVALADVYDALTSERVYKKAFSHETAVDMILNGKCGTFNPLVIECLKIAADDIRKEADINPISCSRQKEMKSLAKEMLKYDELSQTKRLLCQLEHEQIKNQFFTSLSNDTLFEYTDAPAVLTLSPGGAQMMGLPEVIVNPFSDERLAHILESDWVKQLSDKLRSSSPQSPDVQFEVGGISGGSEQNIKIICKSLWSIDEPPHYTGAVGKIVSSSDAAKADKVLSGSRKE